MFAIPRASEWLLFEDGLSTSGSPEHPDPGSGPCVSLQPPRRKSGLRNTAVRERDRLSSAQRDARESERRQEGEKGEKGEKDEKDEKGEKDEKDEKRPVASDGDFCSSDQIETWTYTR